MKPIPVYNVTEITMEEWGAFAPQQKEHHYDHIYPKHSSTRPGITQAKLDHLLERHNAGTITRTYFKRVKCSF